MQILGDGFKLAGEKYIATNYQIRDQVIGVLVTIAECDYKKIAVKYLI